MRISSQRADKINLLFTNQKGGNISRSLERKLENTMAREDFRRAEGPDILPVTELTDIPEQYLAQLAQGINVNQLRQAGHRLVLFYDRDNLEPWVSNVLNSLGITAEYLEIEQSSSVPKDWQWYKQLTEKLATAVQQRGGSGGAIIDPNGDNLILVDSQGKVVSEEILTALISLIILKEQAGPVIVPVTAPRAIDELAARYQGQVIRTKTSLQDFMDRIINHQMQNNQQLSQHFMNFDALLTLLKVLEYCAREGISIDQLVAEIPSFYLQRKEVAVPWQAKGKVIRKLIEEPSGKMELLDGVKVFHPQGWALVLPDPEEPVCRIFTEGVSMEAAEELTNFYTEKIRQISAN